MARTIAYYEGVQGFPSFYSFVPDGIESLNNRLFTFKYGHIWEHNITPSSTNPRNTFYRQGNLNQFDITPGTISESRPSVIEFVFNESPSTVKNFKAFSLEGEGQWDLSISTDQESRVLDAEAIPLNRSVSGTIYSDDWVNREGKLYSYIRGFNETDITNIDLEHNTINGLGQASVVNDTLKQITLPAIPSGLAVDDQLFFFRNSGTESVPTYGTSINFLGVVESISGNVVTYNDRHYSDQTLQPTDASVLSFVTAEADNFDYVLFSKDRVADTSGVIGFFATVKLTNVDNTEKSEVFAIDAEIDLSSGQ